MCQPRAPFRPVVIGTRRANHKRHLRLPVYALRTVWDVEAIADAEAGMRLNLLPGQPIGADVETAPTLGIGNEAGDRLDQGPAVS